MLVDVPKGLVKGDLLFQKPRVAEISGSDPGVEFDLSGDSLPAMTSGHRWRDGPLADRSRCRHQRSSDRISIVPTKHGHAEFPDARPARFELDHPSPDQGPFYQSRTFVREGGGGNRALKQWLGRSFGIRVYSEGFRVLPYGGPKNDWLSLDADYKTRPRALSFPGPSLVSREPEDKDEGLVFLGNSAFFGAVFLTTSGASLLRMLVNPEGFVADPSYERLVGRPAHGDLPVGASPAPQPNSGPASRGVRNARVSPHQEPTYKQAIERSVGRAAELAQEAQQFAEKGDYLGCFVEDPNRRLPNSHVAQKSPNG